MQLLCLKSDLIQYFLDRISRCPKHWLDAQLIHGLYLHANVMTPDFTEQLVDNLRISFVAEMLTEFGFDPGR
jgi:hypothetical protein